MTNGVIQAAFKGNAGAFPIDAAFTVPARGVTALFGPSGCGKTTLLRAMAGLHRFPTGTCVIDGEVWQDDTTFVPAHRRAVGYVFQEASLFPHLSVRRNLLFGAREQVPAGPPPLTFDEVVDMLGLSTLLARGPAHLSGGERQRVAIGRALLSRPRLLLMDEPLAALDRATRDEILPFLERLHTALDLPLIYVSHDMDEVRRLADTLVGMRAGRVEAVGPLRTLQSDPSLPFAQARDAAVTFEAVADLYDDAYGLAVLVAGGLRLRVPSSPMQGGERQRVHVAAGDVSLAKTAPGDSTILNIQRARIASMSQAGPHAVLVALDPEPDGPRLLARVTRLSCDTLKLAVDDLVYAQIKSVALAPR